MELYLIGTHAILDLTTPDSSLLSSSTLKIAMFIVLSIEGCYLRKHGRRMSSMLATMAGNKDSILRTKPHLVPYQMRVLSMQLVLCYPMSSMRFKFLASIDSFLENS